MHSVSRIPYFYNIFQLFCHFPLHLTIFSYFFPSLCTKTTNFIITDNEIKTYHLSYTQQNSSHFITKHKEFISLPILIRHLSTATNQKDWTFRYYFTKVFLYIKPLNQFFQMLKARLAFSQMFISF